jgi:hypothetical protein
MHLDYHFTWKLHPYNLVKKLSSICFVLRKLLPIANVKMLRMTYIAHFHLQLNYGIIFWGLSSSVRNVVIIKKTQPVGLCWDWVQESFVERVSKNWIYLRVPSLYTCIYVLMPFVVKNPNIYQTNTSVHGRTQGNKINCIYLLQDFPQYRKVSIIHLL